MGYTRNLDDHGARLHVITRRTDNGTIAIEVKITCTTTHPTGITTALLRDITSFDLTGVDPSNRDIRLDGIIPNEPPSPAWGATKRHDPTRAELTKIASLYMQALANNLPPTKAVQTWLGTSRPTASRWIRQARDQGLLGAPSKPGLPGNNPKKPKPRPT